MSIRVLFARATGCHYYWIDPARDLAGVIMMQFLPFADKRALAAYDTFERGVYRLAAG